MRYLALVLLSAVYFGQSASAAGSFERGDFSCKPVKKIEFQSGKTQARFDGSIDRFHDSCFSFTARKNQKLDIKLVDFNESASIAIYEPGFTIDYGNFDQQDRYIVWGKKRIPTNNYDGKLITTPPEQINRALESYSGTLPVTGTYLIVVDLAESGASTFGGTISIK